MPQPSPASTPWSHIVALAELSTRTPTRITLEPGAKARAALAEHLGIDELRKLRFAVELTPRGKADWALAAQIGATVVQPCVVSGAPVVTRIDDPVLRHYMADYHEPAVEPGGEVEMPEDDTVEPLPTALDLGAVMAEALALALPLYPRAEGAAIEQATFTEPGREAMSDDDAKPFAALKGLKDKLQKGD